jgi:flagellar motor switch protein FliN
MMTRPDLTDAAPPAPSDANVEHTLRRVDDPPSGSPPHALQTILRIPVSLKVVVGSVTLPVSALASLQQGSLLKLDRGLGDRVDVVANGRVIAKGEIVVLDGDGARYGVTIDELVVDPAAR